MEPYYKKTNNLIKKSKDKPLLHNNDNLGIYHKNYIILCFNFFIQFFINNKVLIFKLYVKIYKSKIDFDEFLKYRETRKSEN